MSVLFLLVSGLYNAAQKAIGFKLDGVYLGLLAFKILLALLIFFLVSVLSGRSSLAKRFKESELKWYNITCAAMLILVCIAGFMKLSPQDLKIRTEQVDKTACRLFSEPGLTNPGQHSTVRTSVAKG